MLKLKRLSDRSMELARVDFSPAHRRTSTSRLLLATVVSLIGSLATDAALVAMGEAVFSSTKGYVHFRFSDYSKLTIIGVIIACLAWPIVTRISSAPRWLFFRMAILVTLVLLLPDIDILKQGQPAKAVAVLMCMHSAIAIVTYDTLVRLAPVRPRRNDGEVITPEAAKSDPRLRRVRSKFRSQPAIRSSGWLKHSRISSVATHGGRSS